VSLKATVATLEEVAEPLRSFYTARDGAFHLLVDGLVPKARLDEFRDNNLSLTRKSEELAKLFEGIDPEAARAALTQANKLREKQLIEAGQVDTLLNERTAAMKIEHDKQIAARDAALGKSTKTLEGLLIDTAIRDAATRAGVRPTAVEDALLRGRQVFRLSDGAATAFDGDKPVFGKDGSPLQVAEWVAGLSETASHLFETSKGAGGKGSQSSGTTPGRISATDHSAFLRNVDDIVAGKVTVDF